MRTSAVLVSFVLLQVRLDTWPVDSSSLGLSESPLSAKQLTDKEYKNRKLDEYIESTLTNLFDQHDIIPEEHYWWGEDCPFNIDEYFRITSHEKTKAAWKKFWERIQDHFSSSNKITGGGLDEEVMTTYGTDGTAKGDMESPLDVSGKKGKGSSGAARRRIGSGWSGGCGRRVRG